MDLTMKINNLVFDLINYAIDKQLIQTDDSEYTFNRLAYLLKFENKGIIKKDSNKVLELKDILDDILDYSFKKSLFEPNSLKQRDLDRKSVV